MWKVTRKGLGAHKLRFALTALAVLLGVAFMSGTFVLTDTIRQTFDDLFADIREGTDAYVRSRDAIENDFGPTQRARIPADLLTEIEAVDGVEAAEGEIQFYAQPVDKDGDTIGNPDQGPPTFGLNWNEVPELNPWQLQPGGAPPEADDEVVLDKGAADEAGFEVGDRITVLTQNPPKEYELTGIVKFSTPTAPRARRSRSSRSKKPNASPTPPTSSTPSRSSGKAVSRRRRFAVASATPSTTPRSRC